MTSLESIRKSTSTWGGCKIRFGERECAEKARTTNESSLIVLTLHKGVNGIIPVYVYINIKYKIRRSHDCLRSSYFKSDT